MTLFSVAKFGQSPCKAADASALARAFDQDADRSGLSAGPGSASPNDRTAARPAILSQVGKNIVEHQFSSPAARSDPPPSAAIVGILECRRPARIGRLKIPDRFNCPQSEQRDDHAEAAAPPTATIEGVSRLTAKPTAAARIVAAAKLAMSSSQCKTHVHARPHSGQTLPVG